ncbi:HLGFF motif protein [Conchiformibius steedae]|uniref:Uncharacterized protein n=1 Tax=Conchiformibius steedae TaxID=153493 RepID=A0A3P2A4F6_9NEIS|nr:hypothetical protein [Conchiformibius steedae]RRD90321.1 hypothetical protein EII21_05200 [Conchiformibius steedae]
MNMQRFSLCAADGTHLGFLVTDAPTRGVAETGVCAFKAAETAEDAHAAAHARLAWLAQHAQSWQWSGDAVRVCDAAGDTVAQVRGGYLHSGGFDFILNDLTGVL